MGQVRQTVLGVAGREVVITNPDKVIFPQAGHTKLDLVKYYAAVAEAALRGIAARPLVLKRYVNGAESTSGRAAIRSEEHTSELQSPCNIVCRLLLEKKKERSPRKGSRPATTSDI